MTSTLERPRIVPDDDHANPPGRHGRITRLVRGPDGDPRWARPGVLALLALTAVLYLWDLSASGYANSFYAAAVEAGTHSWKAWFFGSLDSGNSITVDKPPASLWIMGLSARIFGFNSWSLLVPQALEGVASVGLLYGAVRRVSGHGAGLLAGAILALTPAAVLMFRFDNPDALLVLLMTGAAYAVTRALEKASPRWLMIAGTALGFAFLTKMLQGLLVLPAFAIAYLLFAPTSVRRRVGHLLLGVLSLVVAGGWWVLAVALWPAASRPYIGGSGDNTVLGLVFGYNGLGRIFGGDGNQSSGGGTSGSSFGGSTGLTRLFSSEMGNEISWLLPAALIALVAGLVLTRRAVRSDRTRSALVVWGGWLVVTALVFSYMKGTIHPYYTVALAPAIGAVVAIGASVLWRSRSTIGGRLGLAAMIAAAGGWSYVLLDREPSWYPELRWAVALVTVLAVAALFVPVRRIGRWGRGIAVAGIAAGLVGSAAFGVATAAEPHTGSIPSVGPSVAQTSSMGGASMGGASSRTGSGPSGSSSRSAGSQLKTSGTRPSGGAPSGTTTSGTTTSGTTTSGTAPSGTTTSGTAPSGTATSGRTAGGGGAGATSAALTAALKATSTTWAAAVSGDSSAAELELASGKAVISIGGWDGSDNSPTLAQFEAYVREGKITYYISSGSQGAGGQSGSASQIASWVAKHYTSTTIGGTTVYKLT